MDGRQTPKTTTTPPAKGGGGGGANTFRWKEDTGTLRNVSRPRYERPDDTDRPRVYERGKGGRLYHHKISKHEI